MNEVIESQVLPSGTTVATIYYEDGVNDGDFVVRHTAGKTTTVHKLRNGQDPIRVTKATTPGVYYGVIGVFFDWQEEQNRAPEMLEAQAIMTVTIRASVNLTGREDGTNGWDEAAVATFAKDKVQGALDGIETMIPEGVEAGGILLTDLRYDFRATEVDGLGA